MKNTLPEKYQNGIWGKIKGFFARLFGTNKVVQEETDSNLHISSETEEPQEQDLNTIETLKKESKEKQAKEDIVSKIEKNPELIGNLSLERLQQLNSIYDEKIKENNEIIERLTNKLETLKQQAV